MNSLVIILFLIIQQYIMLFQVDPLNINIVFVLI